MGREVMTIFGLKNISTLPSLANKYFNSLRGGNDEPIYTSTDPFIGIFVTQSLKGGGSNAFNHYYISEVSDEVFNLFSEELDNNGNICDILVK